MYTEPKRTVRMMSAIINFFRFTGERFETFNQMKQQQVCFIMVMVYTCDVFKENIENIVNLQWAIPFEIHTPL